MNWKSTNQKELEKNQILGQEIAIYRTFLRKYFDDFYTEETENFLCFSTRFEEDERISIEQAFNHMFLANFDYFGHSRVRGETVGRLLKIFLQNENLEISKMYLESILKNLCGFYTTGQRWFELKEEREEEETDWHRLVVEKDSSLIQFLSYEFGVSLDYFWNRLQQLRKANFKFVD